MGPQTILIIAGVVAAAAVSVGLGCRVLARRRSPTETPAEPPSVTWRLLRSTAELDDALDRAMACELESMRQSQQRAERYGAMRSKMSASSVTWLDDQRPTRAS